MLSESIKAARRPFFSEVRKESSEKRRNNIREKSGRRRRRRKTFPFIVSSLFDSRAIVVGLFADGVVSIFLLL